MTYTPIVSGTGLTGWAFLERTRAQQQAAFAKSPQITRDKEKFAEQIQSIQTSEQLMDNRDLLRVSLGAFGLDDDINNRAFIKQVLDSDLSDSTSLANRLADKRYLALAQTFNFAGTSGPKVDTPDETSVISDKLAALTTADDLLSDPSLLRATLRTFGLESDRNNTFFLQKVLTSDLNDATSFANKLSDKRYVELAQAFDFQSKDQRNGSLYGFAALFADKLPDLQSAQDLLDSPDLLQSALEIFGLDRDYARTDKPGFLLSVLESDTYDTSSFAAQLDDRRYLALSKAFAFGDTETDIEDSPTAKLIAKLDARTTPIETPDDLFDDVSLTLATMSFFDLPQGAGKLDFARRIVDSDPNSPTSLINVFPDRRYSAFAQAFPFRDEVTTRTYPDGFAEQITSNYIDRQFEIGIGESDTNMRIALSLERDLNDLVSRGGSTDSQWFSVMATTSLRTVFETALRLPESFGAIDLDQQLKVFKERADQFFGTTNVSDFTDLDKLDKLRRSFLGASSQDAIGGTSSNAAIVLALLSG
ncbi:DUF1217 domain-containing protein [Puniceibacterium sp. IMCC21224]|uniref:DUF1217 domain-containing protein n=1 Tax=Puniceibacterium sp. IMCC21224 TaxID=1618204 RepID=UPI00064DBCE2|nr:DUF1217 domain-containing protein [Puniceibacterium sp. IMCC21224]KMK65864.1 Protein of unknown function (DUF1217) [Puniceibacterium sp. IMCC21224]